MRNTIIRVNGTFAHPASAYVKSIGRDGGFTITRDKAKARTFVPATAKACIEKLASGNTRMTFDTCPAEVAHA